MRIVVLASLTLALVACGKTVPLTPDLRASGAASGDVAALPLRVLGTFELRADGRTTVFVRNETPAIGAVAPDDSTITLRVAGTQRMGGQDTLALTFRLSPRAAGTFTLREVNGVAVGGRIPVGGTSYQYFPCYLNVGTQCPQPMAEGTQEDRDVRVGLRR